MNTSVSSDESKMRGEIKFYKDGQGPGNGFGFIWPKNDKGQYHKKGGALDEYVDASVSAEERTEIFFHFSGVKDNLFVPRAKDEVMFVISEGERGDMGDKIELVRAAREKNRTSLIAANVTIGVPKSDVATLAVLLEEIVKSIDTGSTQLPPDERVILVRHAKALKNLASQYDRTPRHEEKASPTATAEASSNGVTGKKKTGKGTVASAA